MSEYDPIAKAQDATAFATSRFGTHYLERLESLRDGHYRTARQLQREGGELALIAAEIARADELDGEIAYFTQAKEITESPTLMQRIRDNLRKKEKAHE